MANEVPPIKNPTPDSAIADSVTAESAAKLPTPTWTPTNDNPKDAQGNPVDNNTGNKEMAAQWEADRAFLVELKGQLEVQKTALADLTQERDALKLKVDANEADFQAREKERQALRTGLESVTEERAACLKELDLVRLQLAGALVAIEGGEVPSDVSAAIRENATVQAALKLRGEWDEVQANLQLFDISFSDGADKVKAQIAKLKADAKTEGIDKAASSSGLPLAMASVIIAGDPLDAATSAYLSMKLPRLAGAFVALEAQARKMSALYVNVVADAAAAEESLSTALNQTSQALKASGIDLGFVSLAKAQEARTQLVEALKNDQTAAGILAAVLKFGGAFL